MTEQKEVTDFRTAVDKAVKEYLDAYKPPRSPGSKAIHDPIWGTGRLRPWEVAALDSPLLQRLRDIRQTGFASLLYPCANHSRFEHTLGVVSIIDRIVEGINRKGEGDSGIMIETGERTSLRLAGLLHDVGHGPFSHVSERVYGRMPEMRSVLDWIQSDYGVTPKEHEALSFLVVRSRSFRSWFDAQIVRGGLMPRSLTSRLDLDRLAGWIIGYEKEPKSKYLADIINGPMDADKLDYLARDAYFGGLAIAYDLDRYLKTIEVVTTTRRDGVQVIRLGLPLSGLNALEQIVISKMMLYSYMYYHQKVRVAEALFEDLCSELTLAPRSRRRRPVFASAADFLRYTDSHLVTFGRPKDLGSSRLQELQDRLARRRLQKRALEIARCFVKGIEEQPVKPSVAFERLLRDMKRPGKREQLANRIAVEATKASKTYGVARGKTERHFKRTVYLDFPPPVEMEEAANLPVAMGAGQTSGPFIELDTVFPVRRWAEGFNDVKWRGRVYADEEDVRAVNKAARAALSEAPYSLVLSPEATTCCKLDHGGYLDAESQAMNGGGGAQQISLFLGNPL